ncbi:MAG TPA: CPBP family intramembrane glutamic endopeptidase [Candidatus Deferrimicrobium sp.]|nr:CPBP family intramembrane glutamic endopeptidase [Candidatus Deferrimicrobium sp.]
MDNSHKNPVDEPTNMKESTDKFSKIFFFIIPFTVPLIVTLMTYLFYPVTLASNLVWLPLLIIYWVTIWCFTFLYRYKRGGVFNKERYKLTLKLKGDRLWLQYLLVYGPFVYSIPLFFINYATELSVNMFLVILLASIINGPSEETFWRACLDDAGKKAGVSEKKRLIFAPIAFALWHTAFIIHLLPWDQTWILWWAGTMLMTWSSGIIWMWVMHRSGRLMPQTIYHACANFLSIFPLFLVTVLHIYF